MIFLENLIFNADSGRFDASFKLKEQKHLFYLLKFNEDEMHEATNAANKILAWISNEENINKTKIYAASTFSKVVEEEEMEIEEFIETYELSHIVAGREGYFEIYFIDHSFYFSGQPEETYVSFNSDFEMIDADFLNV